MKNDKQIEYEKMLEEIKVMQHRLLAMQGLIIKRLEEESLERFKVKK